MEDTVLVVNCGSSSLKLALFDDQHRKLASALAERLGQNDAFARVEGREETIPLDPGASHDQALNTLVAALRDQGLMASAPTAIGHRVVHGGETFREAVLLDDDVMDAIEDCAGLAPLHNPVNLSGIRATLAQFPEVPQTAVFDTAFHQTLPKRAFLYALPEAWYRDWGIRRYGFHGTSHAFMAAEAARLLGKTPATTSIISAHLGNGCSITAIRDGISVDTSMGLTPLEGLVMGTRSGDVDPGLFDFLRSKGIAADEVHRVLNQESGLLGLSGQTNDMRSLCELADHGHEPSRTAIDVFCFRLARYVGAMMASLSQLDALVFTGGIGENSARIRAETINHLKLIGFELSPDLNKHHGEFSHRRVESPDSRFPVLVIPTNEELVIAREASRLAGSAALG
ncbi:acetate kinase [Marinobacter sp. EhC06]|jgi:acetate kinase|uniref:acetate/propionate family kinase n=1 Tax=Marinobacter TaxID=2742 RepID=UPI0007D8D75F|nr:MULTISPECIES: acetate kinase [unclassified Marinobacter]OAN92585.1 acetate kinase [Marinobacter sp. EhN04]OAN95096.1 acetate kinase [Marinobacter sp. EhC06]